MRPGPHRAGAQGGPEPCLAPKQPSPRREMHQRGAVQVRFPVVPGAAAFEATLL